MSKYSDIADVLREEIVNGVYAQDSKLPTENELASSFNVSRQTIRQAISVLKISGSVFQVQGSGTYVAKISSKRSDNDRGFKRIVVICNQISEYIFPSIIRGIESELSGPEYRIQITATGNRLEKERNILSEVIKNNDCDGIIMQCSRSNQTNPNMSLFRELRRMGVPIVFLHHSYNELPDSVVVGMDDQKGGVLAGKKIIEEGCRHICGIFKSDDRQGILRHKGFAEAMMASEMGYDDSNVFWYSNQDIEGYGFNLSPSMIATLEEKGIDGVVCHNDQIATAVIRDFYRAGKKIPKVVSFDDSPLCRSCAQYVYSLGHRKEELGVTAAKKLKAMMDGKKEVSKFFDWIVDQN